MENGELLMSRIKFSQGEVLTAEKLNQLSALVSGVVGGGSGTGTTTPPQVHRHTQKKFTTYSPAGIPQLVDKTSHLPIGEGVKARLHGDTAYSQIAGVDEIAEGTPVYLVQKTDCLGRIFDECLTLKAPETRLYNISPSTGGVFATCVGAFFEDRAVAGTTTQKMRFFERPLWPAIPSRALSLVTPPESVKAPGTGDCLTEVSLLATGQDDSVSPALLFRGLRSTGGMIFRAPSSMEPVQLIPHFSIQAAPSTEAPITEPQEQPWAPKIGEWVTVATNNIAGSTVDLKMQWVTPWKAYMVLDVGESTERKPIEWIWKKAWGIPGVDTPPLTVTINPQNWKLTHYQSPPCVYLAPDSTPLIIYEWGVAEALGCAADRTDCCGKLIIGNLYNFKAYMRRILYPNTGACWCVWWDKCYNFIPWLNS